MRIATWNVNSLRVRLPLLLEWLARTPVLLSRWPLSEASPSRAPFRSHAGDRRLRRLSTSAALSPFSDARYA